MKRKQLPIEEIKNSFEYRDGCLFRKAYVDKAGRTQGGFVNNKSNNSKGYCHIKFNGSMVPYHAILWVVVYGEIPNNKVIDHINGNRSDNRLENLRLVSHRQNLQNQRKHRDGKLAGCRQRKSGKWQAQVRVDNSIIHLGTYNSDLEAHSAYLNYIEKNNLI